MYMYSTFFEVRCATLSVQCSGWYDWRLPRRVLPGLLCHRCAYSSLPLCWGGSRQAQNGAFTSADIQVSQAMLQATQTGNSDYCLSP